MRKNGQPSPKTDLGCPEHEPRVGLLFLVCGNLNQPRIWSDYLKEAEGSVEVYCHAKHPDAIREGPLAGRLIEERHETWWGHLSLVVAMLALLRAALKNPDLTHFVFLSESCIPARSFSELAAILSADSRSRFTFMSLDEAYSHAPDKPRRFDPAHGIPHHNRHFQPQWVLLDREAASILAEDNRIDEFEGVVAADESYFSTVLSMAGWDLNQKVVKQNITWCRWSPGAWHPDVLDEITPELVGEWRGSGCFFARKLSPAHVWTWEKCQDDPKLLFPFWNQRRNIINELIEIIGGSDYLEIGGECEEHFDSIHCRFKTRILQDESVSADGERVMRMSSDEFFETNSEGFDVILIDGLHHSDQVERDIKNALAALNPRGVVVCHDLNPTTEAMQALPRTQWEWTGDGWKAWVRIRSERPDLAMLVVDADYGVGVILADEGPWNELEHVPDDELNWPCFERYRTEWLDLRPWREARQLIMDRLTANPRNKKSKIR